MSFAVQNDLVNWRVKQGKGRVMACSRTVEDHTLPQLLGTSLAFSSDAGLLVVQ